MDSVTMPRTPRNTARIQAMQLRLTNGNATTRMERENARLTQENERLREQCADLAASAELWAQLYEAALDRLKKQSL
jgi:hypothetical protein